MLFDRFRAKLVHLGARHLPVMAIGCSLPEWCPRKSRRGQNCCGYCSRATTIQLSNANNQHEEETGCHAASGQMPRERRPIACRFNGTPFLFLNLDAVRTLSCACAWSGSPANRFRLDRPQQWPPLGLSLAFFLVPGGCCQTLSPRHWPLLLDLVARRHGSGQASSCDYYIVSSTTSIDELSATSGPARSPVGFGVSLVSLGSIYWSWLEVFPDHLHQGTQSWSISVI